MTPEIHPHSSTQIMRRDTVMTEHVERAAPAMDGATGTNELKTYFNVIIDNLVLILGVALVVGVAGVLYALGSKPLFEANMTLLVQESSPHGARNILSEASSMFETKTATVAEMELLRSRVVIGPVVETLRLAVDIQPRRFPVIGAAIAQARGDRLSRPGLFGYGGYAWGAEKLAVSVFKAPGALRQRTFVITATGVNAFRLSDDAHSFAWEGRVGVPLRGKIGGHDLEVQVERLDAEAGAQFLLSSLSKQRLVEGIQAALQISEQGKQSGLVDVRLQGQDPVLVRAILEELAHEYLRQSVARRRADAERSLAFLDAQVSALRAQLDQSDAQYSQLRHRQGTVNLADEARIGVEQAAAAKARLAELQQKKIELLTRYGDKHPQLVAVNDQLAQMELSARLDGEAIKALPALEQDELSITRDNKVKSELYAALSNTAQQLRMLTASQTSNVRLVDAPTLPEGPIKPNRSLMIAVAVMLGLFLGMVVAFIKRAMAPSLCPKAIKKLLGAKAVQLSIPHSSCQQQLLKQAERASGAVRAGPLGAGLLRAGPFRAGPFRAGPIPMLARVAPEDPAIEALRGFRAALQFSLPHFRNNIVMITGATAGLGKSFISANGATVIAASGKKVLLIDADLRAGHLHRYFGDRHTPGLCEAVSGAMAPDAVICREVMKNLDFIPTGTWPRNPSEFLTEASFGSLLASLSASYDLVIIDAPAVLGMADALIIGAHAGAVFLLARAGMTSEDEIQESLKCLNQAGIAPEGILYNDVPVRRGTPEYRSRSRPTQQPIHCVS